MKRLLLALSMAVVAQGVSALEFRLGIENYDAELADYPIKVLELALEKADGDHTLEITTPDTNQSRMLTELSRGEAAFDVMWSGINTERHEMLLTIPFPIQRGLLGHRILIVNEESADDVASVQSIEDAQQISIGSGTGWPDTQILEENGFSVEDASYENLFTMLSRGRIDAYARGVGEPFREVEARSEEFPNLAVDNNVLIVYPFDLFYFVSPNDQERYDIIVQGLTRAYEDGSFMQLFNTHPQIQSIFAQAQIDDRVRFDIPNPLIPEEIASIPDIYWHGR